MAKADMSQLNLMANGNKSQDIRRFSGIESAIYNNLCNTMIRNHHSKPQIHETTAFFYKHTSLGWIHLWSQFTELNLA